MSSGDIEEAFSDALAAFDRLDLTDAARGTMVLSLAMKICVRSGLPRGTIFQMAARWHALAWHDYRRSMH